MDTMTPNDAQRVVAAYLKVVAAHADADTYPSSVADLPQAKETIRAAFKTCVVALIGSGQLTPELRDYLEVAYVSLADYVTPDCVALLREYARAGEALADDRRLAKEKVATEAWRQLSDQSRLAGQLARTISDEADRLRAEFRYWQSDAAVAPS
jgi:hypothetical protein